MTVTFTVVLGILLFTIFIGTPVAFALGATAILSMLIFMDPNQLAQFGRIAFNQGISMNQLVAPLFVLMAEFLAQGNIAADIYTVLNERMKKIKGGLAISTMLACTIFAALCGSSAATAAAIGRISINESIKKGYRPDFAAGVVVAGGTLGIMIPPSLPFVLYGIITETSIAKLLIAGVIPGLMISAMFCIYIMIRVKLNPSLVEQIGKAPNHPLDNGKTAAEADPVVRPTSMRLMILPFLLIFVVLGSMYTGIATPTESAGIGAVGALAIILLMRRFTTELFSNALAAAARTSTMILFLIICGFGLTYVVSYLGLAQGISNYIVGQGFDKWVVLILVYVLWLILGCLMDPGSMVILTVPFMFQTFMSLGFDPIWLGVVSTLTVEIGMITPPVGLNLFVTKSISGLPMGTIIAGSLPFVLVQLIALMLLTVFPQISLWLPSMM
jgi:C4-dicarboxylate transporter DctM subunit